MARVLITGSSDGLGLMAGRLLVEQGHSVILHARNPHRAADAGAALPGADGVLVGDLLSLAGIRSVAGQANAVFNATGKRIRRLPITLDQLL